MLTILEQLEAIADADNAVFVSRLLPDIKPELILGCRTPALRTLAKSLDLDSAEVRDFLQALPHRYFDENQLHAFLIARIRPFESCLAAVEAFLPYINNWATCDQLSPAVFKKDAEQLLPAIEKWVHSPEPYTVRFGIGMLMQHFLDARFRPEYAETVSAIRSEHYYINMEIAWYFATALAKQPDAILPYLTEHRLPERIHRKTIQKAVESRRIPEQTKALLRTLRGK